MKPITSIATFLVALVTCCAGCTTLDLWLPSHVLALDPDKSARWLLGEWQSSGAKHEEEGPTADQADWIVSGGENGVFDFEHGDLHYEVEAVAFDDEQYAALLEVTQVGADGTRQKDSMLYVARLSDEVLSIKPIGGNSLKLDEKARAPWTGIDNAVGLMALDSAKQEHDQTALRLKE